MLSVTRIHRSLASSRERTHKRKAPGEFTFRAENHIPSNFSLAPDVMNNLKNKRYLDPISLNETNITKITQFACVPVEGIFHIYKAKDLMQHITTVGALNKRNTEFRDILTNIHIRTNTVFTVTPDQLYSFFFEQEPVTEPPTKTRKKSR